MLGSSDKSAGCYTSGSHKKPGTTWFLEKQSFVQKKLYLTGTVNIWGIFIIIPKNAYILLKDYTTSVATCFGATTPPSGRLHIVYAKVIKHKDFKILIFYNFRIKTLIFYNFDIENLRFYNSRIKILLFYNFCIKI